MQRMVVFVLKNWIYVLLGIAVLGSVLVLSGCFQTQTTLSYFFYNEATPPASIAHVYVYLKTITANSVKSTIDSKVDLISNPVNSSPNDPNAGLNEIQQAISLNGQTTLSSLNLDLGPVATITYDDGTTKTVNVATSVTADFYGYSSQQYQLQPMTILNGSNKSAIVLWNLSDFSSPLNVSFWNPQIRAFDRDSLVQLKIDLPNNDVTGYYTARVSDLAPTYTFTTNGYLNNVQTTYNFYLYPFALSNGYRANVTVSTATETVNSTIITITSSPITLDVPNSL